MLSFFELLANVKLYSMQIVSREIDSHEFQMQAVKMCHVSCRKVKKKTLQ